MKKQVTRNSRRLGLLVAMGLLVTVPCLGQVSGPHLTVGPRVGYANWSGDVNLESGWQYGGQLGLWINGYLGIEGNYGVMSAKTLHGGHPWVGRTGAAGVDQDLTLYGGNLIFNLAPERVFSPFLLGGYQGVNPKAS